ncbi:MAG: serine/threonine-protein kinase [Myxococcota bacterium]|nr:serine/threonine-protein kinase [Myxococcota bacterium]
MTAFETLSFGRYFLIDKIAVGGMAEVFKAKSFSHGGFEKLLVIKRILQHLSDNEEFVEMFVDEAKISVELQHPNIVQIYDFGRIAENYFIAMECVEGKDIKGILRKLAERRKVLPMEYAVYIAHEMCKGLDYAHKRTDMQGNPLGIIHRDVSPSNILVSYSGEVKVADFGIAKAEISAYNTKGGVLKGKFEYMSPEQASGEHLNHLSDVFATGTILHEMLTGRRLFKTDSDIKTLERIKAVDIKMPSALNPGIPQRLNDIVMKALSQDRRERFADARALQTALLEFMYPATPDLTRENLGHFLTELFSAEIRDERIRLEQGTKAAADLHEHAPEIDLDAEWEESPGSGQTLNIRPSRVPLLSALFAIVALGGALLWVGASQPNAEAPVVEASPEPAMSTVQIEVTPAANSTVKVNGVVIGTGTDVIQSDIPPNTDFELEISAPGYTTFKRTYTTRPNAVLHLPVILNPVRVAAPAPTPSAQPATPEPDDAPIDGPAAAPVPEPPTAPIASPAGKPGMLNVTVRGGWGEVYVNGQRINTTPLYQHKLPSGRHVVEIVKGSTGEREQRTVTIVPNETTRVTF